MQYLNGQNINESWCPYDIPPVLAARFLKAPNYNALLIIFISRYGHYDTVIPFFFLPNDVIVAFD